MLSILAIARPAKEVVSHTFRVEKLRFRWPTAFPSSLNKPVPYPDPRGFLEVFLHEREN